MLAVFEKSIGKAPKEMDVSPGWQVAETKSEMAEIFSSAWPDATFYTFTNANFMALSHADKPPLNPNRSVVVMDDVFCVLIGNIENVCDLRRHYGLTRHTTEAMLVVEIYKVLRDRAPYPPDQLIKDLVGQFAFFLYDARTRTVFIGRDRDGGVIIHWGIAVDKSLVCSDDSEVILDICGMSCAVFPAGCIFLNNHGLVSFIHPMHKVRTIVSRDDLDFVKSVYFQVDLYTRLPSIPRVGSDANWIDDPSAEGKPVP